MLRRLLIWAATLKGQAMQNDTYRSVLHVEVPGDVFITVVVEQTDEEVRIDHQVPEGIPPAVTAILLAQVLSSILPPGLAGFHAWKAYSAVRTDFEAVNGQMANVPAISEDELPF
jgi:hypothetical protein